MFDTIRYPPFPSVLEGPKAAILSVFKINWDLVSWSDLRKPLYSALAARLYLHYVGRNVNGGVPTTPLAQTTYYTTYYRPTGNATAFKGAAAALDKGILN